MNDLTLEKIINFNDIKENSLLLLKCGELNEGAIIAIKNLMELYGDKLKEKNSTFLVMRNDTDISLLSEDEMNRAGWVREKKSLIIH